MSSVAAKQVHNHLTDIWHWYNITTAYELSQGVDDAAIEETDQGRKQQGSSDTAGLAPVLRGERR